MLTEFEIERKIDILLNGWKYSFKRYGKSLWVYLNDGKANFFQIQVAPDNGFAVSRMIEKSDFGHEEAYDNLDDALRYIAREKK